MRYIRSFAVLATAAVITAACASSGGTGRTTGSRDVLTRQQLMETSSSNAFEAIQRLRPTWLRTRGTSSTRGSSEIVVFMDGVRVGEVDFLRSQRLDNVIEIRFVNARDATTRWGTGFSSGVIEVITR
jgi:hypothetical protein